jgi:hypothetical protein
MPPELLDLEAMPGYNLAANTTGRRERAVTDGLVYWDEVHKVCCKLHRAMLCVNRERTIWRCPWCHTGAYVRWPDPPPAPSCPAEPVQSGSLVPGRPAGEASARRRPPRG